MGLNHRVKKMRGLPLRLDVLAKDLCGCECHNNDKGIHPGKHCACNPAYKVDGRALAVVQCREREVT